MNYPQRVLQNKLDSTTSLVLLLVFPARLGCFYPLYVTGYFAGSGTSELRDFGNSGHFIMTYYLKLVSCD